MSTRDDNIAALSTILPLAQRRDWDRLDGSFAPNYADHDPAPGQQPGLDGIKWYWRNFTAAFPDFTPEPLVITADEDYVTLVARTSGTHTGTYQGNAPTGRRFSFHTLQLFRFAGGLIVERWGVADPPEFLRQLRAVEGGGVDE